MSDRHKQLGVPATASGVEFGHGGATINIDASGVSGRIVVSDENGNRAAMVMPAVVLEGVLRGALDSMARATYEARMKRWDSPLCRPKAGDISPAGSGRERGAA